MADKIAEQILAYVKIDETMVGFAPGKGKMCLAKSKDDNTWYRASCLNPLDDNQFEIFFVDYGFIEVLPRDRLKMIDPILMETVFLANHCILEGFDNSDPELVQIYEEKYGDIIKERVPFMTEKKLQVLKQHPDGYYVIHMPKMEDLNPKVAKKEPLDNDDEEKKKLKIKELEEQINKLRMA